MLDGRYRVDALIAVGGMATVYRAVDIRLDRVVALKVMHPALAADVSFVERFIREAKSVARLDHPNVVGVYDQGAEGANVYLAMEYIAGCTLRDVLRERGALRPRAALDILEPILAALGAAHRAGLVHRDMKPENVLIGDDGRVKVADFGLVRAVDTVTQTTGAVLGTVSYLAPEQIEHGTADPRVDVYACGVMLHEMLTGAKPHTGDSAAQVLYRHLNEDVPPPSAAVPGLPAVLDDLVATAAARVPEARPADAVGFLARVRVACEELTDAQLDSVPPGATEEGHDNAYDRTSVIPRALRTERPPPPLDPAADEAALNRTSRLETSPPPPAPRALRRAGLPRRGTLAVIVAVVLALGIGVGVWYINTGQFTQVPPLLTKTEKEAEKRLHDSGLSVKSVKRQYSDSDDRGTVMGTDPASGARIRGNGKVTLTISRGPRIVAVPDIVGSELDRARDELRAKGLPPGMVTRAFSDDVPKGSVIKSDPAPGSKRRTGTPVALTVSKGEAIEVPGVSGESLDDARSELEEEGLKVAVSPKRVFSDEDKGDVAKQSPAEGRTLAEGGKVTLTLSKGQDMVEVPDVTDKKADEAKKTLEDAGFTVGVSRWFFGDTVWDQSVDGGDEAPRGSRITIRVR
ncbi:Stk1 family PASTA domain-containing Ser/Thr kinase [Streptomyces tsukubensis]|uniref:non-specific serine/threonine protein kinase n=1 Tax=Streptomyces tsukubensis TaxID=83656 RepID=A0A1V4A842_9ACTN|nr:serine/threonine protein kinase [Streptomyces tsukubensis]QFR97606.1 Stk1 family PASTA domain-containing Ser/Thr kinase [Streptomyces tsukubensis]